MPRCPVVASAAGVWPIASYLHVPKVMPQAQWLMLGSAFAIDTSNLRLDPGFAAKHDNLMITAAHTFAPWRSFKVNIPDEWRKGRYVTGKLLQYDAHGAADNTKMHDLGLIAVHPTVDVALVKVMKSSPFFAQCRAGPTMAPPPEDNEDADVNDMFARFKLVTPEFASDADAAASVPATVLGFRGRGDLGSTEQMSEEEGKKMSAADRQAKIDNHKNAVGRQDLHLTKVRLLKDAPIAEVPPLVPAFTDMPGENVPGSSIYARAAVEGGACYAGMSGCPVVTAPFVAPDRKASRNAAGVLFRQGLAGNKTTEVLYVPSAAVVSWLESLK